MSRFCEVSYECGKKLSTTSLFRVAHKANAPPVTRQGIDTATY